MNEWVNETIKEESETLQIKLVYQGIAYKSSTYIQLDTDSGRCLPSMYWGKT